MSKTLNPDNVWLQFDTDEDEGATREANIYRDGDGYRVEWYHVAVGLVTRHHFDTLAAAEAFLIREGFENFTS